VFDDLTVVSISNRLLFAGFRGAIPPRPNGTKADSVAQGFSRRVGQIIGSQQALRATHPNTGPLAPQFVGPSHWVMWCGLTVGTPESKALKQIHRWLITNGCGSIQNPTQQTTAQGLRDENLCYTQHVFVA
jgi:hypothetical protein